MDAIDRRLRERLQRAGIEMSGRPLDRWRTLDEPREGGRRSLRPLLAAAALAVAVASGGVAGGLGLHGRLNGRQPGPATSAPASPAAHTPSASPASPYAAAPIFHQVSAVWDSTHKQIVAYDYDSNKGGSDRVWTWHGSWLDRSLKRDGLGGFGILVDAPGMGGVLFLGSSYQLWVDGSLIPQRGPSTPQCMFPLEGAWDYEHNELVAIYTDQCTGGTAPLPAETWTYDAHTWQRHADVPAVRWPTLAWDPGSKSVVLLGALGNGSDSQAWTWTGTAWTRGPASHVSFPSPAAGAGWDGRKGAVVVWAPADAGGPARAQQYSDGVFKELAQDGYPERTAATIADTTHGRLLAIGQKAIPVWAKASPEHQLDDYYVLEWTGTTWTPITYSELSTTP